MSFKRKRPATEYYHCTECRKDLVGKEFRKQPIGYEERGGKLLPHSKRFYLFCVACGKFLGIIDPDRDALIKSVNKTQDK